MQPDEQSTLMRLALVVLAVLGSAIGCSSEAPPKDGAPASGAPAPAQGPSPAEIHEAAVREVLGRLGPGHEAELAALRLAPLVETRLTVDAANATFEGRLRYAAVNQGPEALTSVSFEVPRNDAGRGARPAVALTAARVGGRDVTALGTVARWEIPVAVKPGERAEVELVFKGDLANAWTPPEAGAPDGGGSAGSGGLEAVLGQLGDVPELASLRPIVPITEARRIAGRHGEVLVLAGVVPRPVGARVIMTSEIVTAADLDVDATGSSIGSGREGDRVVHRFVALEATELGVVVSHGLAAATSMMGDVPVTLRTSAGAAEDLGLTVRRALEGLEARWGKHGPRALGVVAVGDLDAVAALEGLILVPGSLLPPEPAPPGPGAAKGISLTGLLGGMVEHHPAAKEALAFAVTTAVAQQWWAHRGADEAAENLLREGLARVGALAVIAERGGDKTARRALELGLRLPVQLALRAGEPDVVLAAAPATREAASLAALKAGLFGETLGRHLGDAGMASLASALMGHVEPLTVAAIRQAIMQLAPRPEETRALLARWLDERHLDEDVGPLRPEVLIEYLVSDGAIGSITDQLMGQLGPDRLGGKALGLLGQGHDLDAGLALSLLGELAANEADPATRKWLTLGTRLLGSDGDRKQAVDGLVDELGGELGIPENDRSRLKQLGTLLFEALGEDGAAPSPPPPPPGPAPAP